MKLFQLLTKYFYSFCAIVLFLGSTNSTTADRSCVKQGSESNATTETITMANSVCTMVYYINRKTINTTNY